MTAHGCEKGDQVLDRQAGEVAGRLPIEGFDHPPQLIHTSSVTRQVVGVGADPEQLSNEVSQEGEVGPGPGREMPGRQPRRLGPARIENPHLTSALDTAQIADRIGKVGEPAV